MVFCGKPSKACQRCRDKKLRCDFKTPSCSSCIRAFVECGGYRDTAVLRIRDQSTHVKQKVQAKEKPATPTNSKENALKQITRRRQLNFSMVSLSSLSLSEPLESQARTLFFTYYVNGFSLTWDFLSSFEDPFKTPAHLTLSIDAVSLAFLFRHHSFPPALALARQKYVAALRETHQALQASKPVSTETMLDTSMLLDLFEHMCGNPVFSDEATGRRGSSNLAHVKGALALVQNHGLELFDTRAELRALMRLSTNAIITSVANRIPVPEIVTLIRKYAAKIVDINDPKWRLSDLMIYYASLLDKMDNGSYASEEIVQKFLQMDAKYEELLENGMREPWLYTRHPILPRSNDKVFGAFWDQYSNRTTTQAWNVTRAVRVSIHEIIQGKSDNHELFKKSKILSWGLIEEVLASVPQFTDCHFCAAHTIPLPPSSYQSPLPATPSTSMTHDPSTSTESRIPIPKNHPHNPAHNLDIFTLLFPLYVCAWSRFCTPAAREWIKRQLEHMSEHWGIRNAAVVAKTIEENEWWDNGTVKRRTDPWDVYAMLGSYAFAA